MSHIKVRGGKKDEGKKMYWHHGIKLRDGQVVDFGGGESLKKKKRVRLISMNEFTDGGRKKVEEVHYKPGETLDRDMIIRRAKSAVKRGFGRYDLMDNNCEHFATWCMTSKAISHQVEKAAKKLDDTVEFTVQKANGEVKRGFKPCLAAVRDGLARKNGKHFTTDDAISCLVEKAVKKLDKTFEFTFEDADGKVKQGLKPCLAAMCDPIPLFRSGLSQQSYQAGLAPVGFAPVESAPIGSAPIGSAPVGFTPIGSIPVELAPTGFIPIDLTPGRFVFRIRKK